MQTARSATFHSEINVTPLVDVCLVLLIIFMVVEQLAGELQRLRAESNRPVIVRADKSLSYGDVVAVLDACRTAGFDEVGLGTEKNVGPALQPAQAD